VLPQVSKSTVVLEKACSILSFRERIRGFYDLLRQNSSCQLMSYQYQSEMLAVVEHNTDLGHCILLNNTNKLDGKSKCQNQLVQEATDIKPYPNNLNQEDGFSLLPIQTGKPLIHSLEERRQQATLPHFNTNIHMNEVYYSLPFTSYRQKFILFAQILLVVALRNIHY